MATSSPGWWAQEYHLAHRLLASATTAHLTVASWIWAVTVGLVAISRTDVPTRSHDD